MGLGLGLGLGLGRGLGSGLGVGLGFGVGSGLGTAEVPKQRAAEVEALREVSREERRPLTP